MSVTEGNVEGVAVSKARAEYCYCCGYPQSGKRNGRKRKERK
jgi:hypothetical protein